MEAIKYYVKGAFQGVKETPEVLEQQEELVADLTAKVADLVGQGKSEEEALGMAIASTGDLSPLVAEFESAEDDSADASIPDVAVYATRLDLAVATLGSGIGAAVMIASTVLGASMRVIDPGASLPLLAAIGAAAYWIRSAYTRYHSEPALIETRPARDKLRFRNALLVWVAVCLTTFALNVMSGSVLWFWPVWVAAAVLPGAVKLEERLMTREEFAAPEEVAEEAA